MANYWNQPAKPKPPPIEAHYFESPDGREFFAYARTSEGRTVTSGRIRNGQLTIEAVKLKSFEAVPNGWAEIKVHDSWGFGGASYKTIDGSEPVSGTKKNIRRFQNLRSTAERQVQSEQELAQRKQAVRAKLIELCGSRSLIEIGSSGKFIYTTSEKSPPLTGGNIRALFHGTNKWETVLTRPPVFFGRTKANQVIRPVFRRRSG